MDDYIELREKVGYVESVEKANSALQTQERGQKSGMRHDAHSSEEPEHGRNEKPKWTDIWLAALTGALAMATFALFLDAKEKGRKELRAYVGLDTQGLYFVDRQEIGGGHQPKLAFSNYGKTPAHNVSIHRWHALTRPVNLEPYPDDEVLIDNFMIHPGQRSPMPMNLGYRINQRFFVWGYVEYTDIYDHRWRFRFAHEHHGFGEFWPDPEHNDEKPA